MGATLPGADNQTILDIIGDLAFISLQIKADNARFGPHPAAGADGYAQRKNALAKVGNYALRQEMDYDFHNHRFLCGLTATP